MNLSGLRTSFSLSFFWGWGGSKKNTLYYSFLFYLFIILGVCVAFRPWTPSARRAFLKSGPDTVRDLQPEYTLWFRTFGFGRKSGVCRKSCYRYLLTVQKRSLEHEQPFGCLITKYVPWVVDREWPVFLCYFFQELMCLLSTMVVQYIATAILISLLLPPSPIISFFCIFCTLLGFMVPWFT